jgi:hypothetical protein
LPRSSSSAGFDPMQIGQGWGPIPRWLDLRLGAISQVPYETGKQYERPFKYI